MEDGQIIERGNHEELIAMDGAYAQLHSRQFREVAKPSVNGHSANGVGTTLLKEAS